MKERPILFSAPMVRAILEGRKTQTRRAVKPQPYIDTMGNFCWNGSNFGQDFNGPLIQSIASPIPSSKTKRVLCPYGRAGDRLWVREAFMHEPADYCWEASVSIPVRPAHTIYRADSDPNGEAKGIGWKPSIHMPRNLSRIDLEITGVCVERLHEINEADALQEGVTFPTPVKPGRPERMARDAYMELWEQINGDGSWDANPWVWVVEFKRVNGEAE